MIRRLLALACLPLFAAALTACPPLDPWVNTADTGVPPGTVLKPQSQMPPQAPGIVYDGYEIGTVFRITQPNVTVRNSRITGSTSGLAVHSQSTGARLENVTINASASASIGFGNITCYRCDIFGFNNDGAKFGDGTHIVESWIHGFTPASGSHGDGIQQESLIPGSASIVRSVIEMGPSIGNAALFLQPDLGGTNGGTLLVQDNKLAGGNFTLQVKTSNNGLHQQSHVSVINNTIVKNSWRQEPGYGPVRITTPIEVWTDNKLDDGTPCSVSGCP